MALIMKTGTFSNTDTIKTGLSSIELFVFYRTAINSVSGALSAAYHKTAGIQYTGVNYSTALSTLSYGYSDTILSVDGGTVTYSSSGGNAIASGETYTWIAYGEE